MSPARLVLTISAVGFMRARSAADTMPRVASISLRCKDSTSDSANSASLLAATVKPSARACVTEFSRPHASTFMPKALP
jgi:hypothetical protein